MQRYESIIAHYKGKSKLLKANFILQIVSYPFNPNGFSGKTVVYPDCTAENTKAEAVLVNYETMQEAAIGSYILHPDTANYETVSEDIEGAFQQVQK